MVGGVTWYHLSAVPAESNISKATTDLAKEAEELLSSLKELEEEEAERGGDLSESGLGQSAWSTG